MTIKIDLHNHSVRSGDSIADYEDSIESAINAGLDGIAFTEHNSYSASAELEELKEKYRGRLIIIRAVEYSAFEGHALLFGVKDDSFAGAGLHAPIKDLVSAVNGAGGAVVIPHPFREWLLLRADIGEIGKVAAIEACNGHNNREENELALKTAERLGLPTTGGSDSHNSEEVGRCYTEFFDEVTEKNFIEALKKGNFRGVYGGKF